jgi:RNA binding exosome subunit
VSSVPFHYIDLRAFCYATEEPERVRETLDTLMPTDGQDPPSVERQENDGFHGDRILVLSSRMERADAMRYALARLAEAAEFETLLDQVEERVDSNCAFYVQLDKQAAFDGRIRLGEGISVRAKVEAYPAKRATAIENARTTLLELRG